MQVSAKSQYGLRAMACLAKFSSKENPLPVSAIFKKEGISARFLEKILAALEKAGLVKSKKGFNGGYWLSKNARKITVADILNCLEDIAIVKCTAKFGAVCGKADGCSARSAWSEIQKAIDKSLKSITLNQISKQH